MKFILARKIEMTQRFRPDGTVVPVTVLEAGPCVITAIRTPERDGYAAVQVGFGTRRELTKPLAGHLKGLPMLRTIREFRFDDTSKFERGAQITADTFAVGESVMVQGMSKGKGFAGVVKRHGFHGHPTSHGHKDQTRMPGSIGSKRQGPVAKGKRMAGRMGGESVTVKNLEVMEADAATNRLVVKGAVPGARGSLVLVKGD